MRFRLALILALAPFVLHAQNFSSLEERMSEAEFKAAGLDKLAPEELAALNEWLRSRGQATAPAAAPVGYPPAAAVEDRRGFSSLDASYDAIVSRISGEFTGWNGSGDEITLENGMVWKTSDPASRLAVKLTNPVVTVTPGVFNAWFLKVEGYNTRVRVVRVR
jgi:hypothetical protein